MKAKDLIPGQEVLIQGKYSSERVERITVSTVGRKFVTFSNGKRIKIDATLPCSEYRTPDRAYGYPDIVYANIAQVEEANARAALIGEALSHIRDLPCRLSMSSTGQIRSLVELMRTL